MDHIYAAGGNPAPSTAAHVYSISGNTWTPIASLPISMAYCGGAFAMGKFYVMGGTVAPANTSLYEYDPIANTWTPKPAVPNAVWFATMSVSNDPAMTKVFSIGGGGGYGSWPGTPAVQIYDPATNTWTQDTPLPAAYGTNASDYCFNGVGMSAGGYDGLANHAETYKGTGFPSGGGPALDVTMTPINPPIILPASGGSFNFNATVQRNVGPATPFFAWARIRWFNGSYSGITLGPVNINPPVGVTVTRLRTQVVPAGIVNPNNYYVGYANTTVAYPAIDADSFAWTGPSPFIGDSPDLGGIAKCFGEPFPGEVITVPSTHTVLGNYPNPFNPSTTISYTLNLSGNAQLTVYDLGGRQVAQLVNGYRQAGNHSVTFDGSNLASGVYVYTLSANGQTATAKMVLMK
jgi:hypothetical protein